MARLSVLLLSLLLVSGSVVIAQDSEDPMDTSPTDAPDTPTTPSTTTAPSTTTTPSTTTPTTTPSTTTPTTTPSTTTTPQTTTPETTTPSTTTPSTTTPSTTTMTPTTTAPDPNINYNVTSGNLTCVMIKGDLSFSVNYTLVDNTTKVVKVEVPAHGGKVNGSCTGPDGTQWIQVVWGPAASSSNLKITFSKSTSDNTSWTMDEFTAALFMDNDTFVNIAKEGVILDLEVYYNMNPLTVSFNHSYNCKSSLSTKNVTSTIAGAEYNSPVTAAMESIQIQAFNAIPNEPDFVDPVHCTADQTSDIVPIAVGCALAGLVIIVLIAYLVGRRRRSGAYQSV